MNLSASSIKNYLSAISFVHKINDYPDPTKPFKVKKVMDALKNLGGPIRKRLPITSHILKKMIAALPTVIKKEYDHKLFRCIFSLMYHASLRISEIANTKKCQHAILNQNIRLKKDSLKVKLVSYKHSKNQSSKISIQATKNLICPVAAFSQFKKVRDSSPGVFFKKANGIPITRAQVSTKLKQILNSIQYNEKNFNTHSFRSGRITDLHKAGLSDSQLRHAGRFKSNAYLRYIKPNK